MTYDWLKNFPEIERLMKRPPFEPIKVTLRRFGDDRWIASIEGHGDGATKPTEEAAALSVMGDYLEALGRGLHARKVEAARVALDMFKVEGPPSP